MMKNYSKAQGNKDETRNDEYKKDNERKVKENI